MVFWWHTILGSRHKNNHILNFYFIGDKTETSGNWDMLPSLGLRAPCASAEDLTCHEDSPASSGLATDDDDVRTLYIFSRILNFLFVIVSARKWYFVTKLFWPTVRKNCSSDREKLLKFEAEGWEFAKFLRSLEQFIQTVKGQNRFWL